MPNFYFIHKDAELTLINIEIASAENKTKAKTVFNKTLLKYKSKNTIKDFRILSNDEYNKIYQENEKNNLEKEISKLKLQGTLKLMRRLIEDEYVFPPFTKKQIKNLGFNRYNNEDYYVLYGEFSGFGNFVSISDIVNLLEDQINDDDSSTYLFFSVKTGEPVQLNVTVSDIKFTASDSSYVNLALKSSK